MPNGAVYPFQWLWDSCFHAVTWAVLGEGDRARRELAHLFRTQSPLGFVPHVDYEHDPAHHAGVLAARGPVVDHPAADVRPRRGRAARRGVRRRRPGRARRPAGSRSCSTSAPASTGWSRCAIRGRAAATTAPGGTTGAPVAGTRRRWYDVKGELVATVEHAPDGSPLANPSFVVASCGFNALVAFNALELASVTGDRRAALRGATRWSTSSTAGGTPSCARGSTPATARPTSGRMRTLDALLPVLVSGRADAVDGGVGELLDPAAFGGGVRSGRCAPPRAVVRGPHLLAGPGVAPAHLPDVGRGPASGEQAEAAAALGRDARRGARVASGWAEYWDADDGTGLGCRARSRGPRWPRWWPPAELSG